MKELFPLIGVIPSMNIPFTADNRVDMNGLQRSIQYAVDSGVASMMLPVVASEVSTLTPEERGDIISAALEITRGKIPVVGGASAETLDQCLHYVEDLNKAGCDGVLVNIPYENDEQYTEYVRAVDALHPGFLMIQDFNIAGQGVSPDLLVQLFEEVESFRCLKIETNLPGPKFSTMLEKTGGRLNVLGGWSITQYIEGLDRGVHGMVPTCMHEIYCKIDKLYRTGHRELACKLYQRIQPIIVYSNQAVDISLRFYKRMLWRMGIFETPNLRVKTIDFDPYYQRIADDMIDLYFEVSKDVRAGLYDV